MFARLSLPILAVAVVAASSAVAADMPSKGPAYAPPPPPPLWTGFYVGLNAGWGWADVGSSSFSNDISGFVGGGQVGYNWQAGQWVFGIEGDFQGTGQDRSDSGIIAGIPFTVDQSLPWFATLRGRVGYAPGPWLLYVTGGVAWLRYELEVSAPGGSVSDHTTNAAWTLGGGVEWMFMPKWSAKLEYLYMDTTDTSVTLFGNTFEGSGHNNVIRLGVNYHF
jgi:outer membrane immunogenic protein